MHHQLRNWRRRSVTRSAAILAAAAGNDADRARIRGTRCPLPLLRPRTGALLDWHPGTPGLENKVLLPVLEDSYERVLHSGKFRLVFQDGGFVLLYCEYAFPLAPDSYPEILHEIHSALDESRRSRREEALISFSEIVSLLTSAAPAVETIKQRLAELHQSQPAFQAAMQMVLQNFNGRVGDPRSFDRLDALLQAQHHRLACWQTGPVEINYRRFFDVAHLAAVRMELPEVFEACHELVFRLLVEGKATGLRIDHPDGLWNPTAYFRQLQVGYLVRQLRGLLDYSATTNDLVEALSTWVMEQTRRTPAPRPAWPLFVVAEKILSQGESLPADWAADGTTGYDFLNLANGLFVDPDHEERFDRIYREFSGCREDFRMIALRSKKLVLETLFVGELNALARRLKRWADRTVAGRNLTFDQLRAALGELVTAFPVYRTYQIEHAAEASHRLRGNRVDARRAEASRGREAQATYSFDAPNSEGQSLLPSAPADEARAEQSESEGTPDEEFIETALAEAKLRNPQWSAGLFNFIGDLLLHGPSDTVPPDAREEALAFVGRFQQLTGPVMAKGWEDTAFYVYHRLLSFNEVGGHPGTFGVTLDEFHRQNALRAEQWPHSLLATATRDTKRGEDVRARLNVLSEIPEEWAAALQRWRSLNAGQKTMVHGQPAPDANDECLLYQTLLGAWPATETVSEAGSRRRQGADFSAQAVENLRLVASTATSSAEFQPRSGSSADVRRAFRERVTEYLLKAVNEAKVHTSWMAPNREYESAAKNFVERLLHPSDENDFLADFNRFQRRVAFFGRFNSLSQTLLKMTCPGVPDIYQGTELWELSLVDPDNRRPVDFATRRRLLEEVKARLTENPAERASLVRDLLEQSGNGQIKLFLIFCALQFRRRWADVFANGRYLPIHARGSKREHVCSFARVVNERAAIVVVPRLIAGLTDGAERPPTGGEIWQDTWLELSAIAAGQKYRNAFTGERLAVEERENRRGLGLGQVLNQFPAALLEQIPESEIESGRPASTPEIDSL